MATEWILSSNSMDCVPTASTSLLLCQLPSLRVLHGIQFWKQFLFSFQRHPRCPWCMAGFPMNDRTLSVWSPWLALTNSVVRSLSWEAIFSPSSRCLLWKRQLLRVFLHSAFTGKSSINKGKVDFFFKVGWRKYLILKYRNGFLLILPSLEKCPVTQLSPVHRCVLLPDTSQQVLLNLFLSSELLIWAIECYIAPSEWCVITFRGTNLNLWSVSHPATPSFSLSPAQF